jgi:hypothetical protein
MKNELQNVISGKGEVRHGANIQAAAGYLKRSQGASKVAKDSKLYKEQEAKVLKKYISTHNFWVSEVNIENYVSEGAEQKVYLKSGKSVIKLNDAIFYNSWEDYFHNLLLHNYFFPDTAYNLLGFYEEKDQMFSVVEQPFVKATQQTNLDEVKSFMFVNGFLNSRNNDYYHPDLGIILEDLHDENVLTENGILQFIDTVFYITDNFYQG